MVWFCMHFLWFVWTDFLWIPRCGPSGFNGLIVFKFSWGNIITLRGSLPNSLQLIVFWSHITKSYYHSHGDSLLLTIYLKCHILTITWTSNYYSYYNENLTWVPVQPTQHHYITKSVPSGANAPQTPHTIKFTSVLSADYFAGLIFDSFVPTPSHWVHCVYKQATVY